MSLPVDLPATFTTGHVLRLGVHPRRLYAWRDSGEYRSPLDPPPGDGPRHPIRS
jgi:hypothetical protein